MTTWTQPPRDLPTHPASIDLWLVVLNLSPSSTTLHETLPLLSPAEQQAADQFKFPADAHRYISAHAALRRILSRYTKLPPATISFTTNAHGKPQLSTPVNSIEFNLSHSDDHALIGISRGKRIGVDIERIRTNLDIDELTSRWFSARERADLGSVPAPQRTGPFFNCWTRKEAFVKARGLGLSLPLDQFDVSCLPSTPPALLASRHPTATTHAWTLHAPPVPPGYAAAAAVEGRDLKFHHWMDTGSSTA